MAKKANYLLDSNVVLRFLLADHPQLSLKAKDIFKEGEQDKAFLAINHTTVAEVVWVLESFYRLKSDKVAELMIDLVNLTNVKIIKKNMIVKALVLSAGRKIDYIDAYNLIFAKTNQLELKTFDNKLAKMAKSKTENIKV